MATDSKSFNPRAIFSKTGKGVQEASGKTSHLSRSDRNVLKEIDGKTALADVALKFEKISADKFDALIQQLDKDGFIREVSSGASSEPIAPIRRPATPPPKAPAPKAAPPPSAGGGDDMDFTAFAPTKPAAAPPPKGPAVDLAAASRAEAERKAKEQAAFDYKGRAEAEARAAAEKAKAEAEARAHAATERAKAEADARAKAEAEARSRAEAESKSKQARDMALRMAAEAKARAEAESKDKARLEAELKGKLEEERKAREEAEKRAAEASERARKEHEEKAKREAEEMRQRLEAEMKAKLDEERRAREEEDRKRREEDDRRRKAEDERRAKEDAERRAKEQAERKQREEEDRKRREEDERRRKEENERRAKEDAERKHREEEDRKRRAKEDEERRARDEQDRKRRREDDELRKREDADRGARQESDRRASEAAAPPPPPAAAAGGGDLGGLLDDLDSFGRKEEEELKAKEEAERKEKQEAEQRARAEEEKKRREQEERKRREEEERRAKAEAERKAKEEEERREREEEERRQEEEAERKRKAKEAQEKKQAEQRAAEQKAAGGAAAPRKAPAGKDDDIGVSDDDLDMDDVKRDEAAISKEARRAAKEREEATAAALRAAPRPKKWGKPAAVALFVILIGGVGALHVMPLSTADYEKAASEALGAPVKVGSARLSVITGVQVNLENVAVGDAKIRLVRGYPEIGSVFGAKKVFNRLEIEGAALSQEQLGGALFGKIGSDNFRVARIVMKQIKLDGPLTLPALDFDARIDGDGTPQFITVSGPDKLAMKITPSGANVAFEMSAGSFAIPFVPAMALSDFGWKGTATRQGITSSEFDGRQFDGLVSGNARVRWGANWSVEGELRGRGIKVAVFAPTLVSEGKVEGRGNYTMSGPAPAKLGEAVRLDGSFKIENGVIGNFALRRALETGGAQSAGRTEFAELTGQGVYDKGAVQLRNLNITSGAMSAGASLDIDPSGALAGRIAAEVKTPNQTLKAVLNISGSLQNPVVKK